MSVSSPKEWERGPPSGQRERVGKRATKWAERERERGRVVVMWVRVLGHHEKGR